MRIFLASYQSLMLNKGGPTYKILHLKKALEELQTDVKLFDMWDSGLILGRKDLVHIFNAGNSTYSLAKNLVACGARYVVNPIFFSNHAAVFLRLYQGLDAFSRRFLIRSYSDYSMTRDICEEAEKVLPNTIAEGELLRNGLRIKADKIQVIHNGVEARFAAADPALFQKKFGMKDFILYAGHLGPIRKNGRKIIQALQKIDHPSVVIADVQHNEEGEWCRRKIEKSSQIKLIEWLEHDDPLFASAYAACHTFILPTRYETPGRAALEAGLAGANIVITPKGGTKEYFADMALYPDPLSVDSIRNCIVQSLNTPRTTRLKNHILQNFVWEVIAGQTLEMYRSVLEK